MTVNKPNKTLLFLENFLAWNITVLCGILGIIFIALANGDKTGYSYGAIFLSTAAIIAPFTKFPTWAKIIIAMIMVFLVL